MKHGYSKGFTLVEMVVVMPLMLLTIAALGVLLINVYVSLSIKAGRLALELESQQALFAMRDELFYAVGFSGKNQSDTTDTFQPSGGWNAVAHNALIVYEASYTKNRQSVLRSLVYKKDSPHECTSEFITENQYSTNSVIYFKSGDKLYRRILIPDQSVNCNTTYRKKTCPSANVPVSCSEADTLIADNVKTFTLSYYRRNNDQGAMSLSQLQNDPTQFIHVSRAEIALTLEKIINSEPVQVTAKINIKKIE